MTLYPTATGRPLRYSLVGPGAHAHEQLLPALRLLGDARLVAVAGRRIEVARAAAERWGVPAYTETWREVADPSVSDVVVVAAAPCLHAEIAAHCLPRGVHVFVEKPPAPDVATLADVASAEDAAAPAGTRAFVGFNFAYADPYRKLVAALAPYGEIAALDLRFVSSQPTAPVWHYGSVEESLLWGLGIHAVDLAVRQFGEPDDVVARSVGLGGGRLAVHLLLRCGERLAAITVGNHSNRFEYRCEAATDGGAVAVLDHRHSIELTAPSGTALDPKAVARYDWPGRRGGFARAGYSGQLEDFHRSIRTAEPSTSSLRACLPAYRAVAEACRQVSDG